MSKSAYCSLCSKINYNACFQAFVGSSGWCFVIFPAVSLSELCDLGLDFGPVLLSQPFLMEVYWFQVSFEQVQVFSLDSWISSAPASLLFYFSAFLRVCSFVLCLYAFPAFPAFPLFCYFLLFCFSAFLASLCSVSLFFCFLFFLLRCFSTSLPFYFYLSFSAVMHLHDISNKDKNMQTIPIFRVTFSRIWIVQASVIGRFPIWPNPTYYIWESAYHRSDSSVPHSSRSLFECFWGFWGCDKQMKICL